MNAPTTTPIHHSTATLAAAAHAEGMRARSWSVSPSDTMIAVCTPGDLYLGTISGALAINAGCKRDREILGRIVARVQAGAAS